MTSLTELGHERRGRGGEEEGGDEGQGRWEQKAGGAGHWGRAAGEEKCGKRKALSGNDEEK